MYRIKVPPSTYSQCDMPLLVPERIKSSKVLYDSLLSELELLLRQYQIPGDDLKHDEKIYFTLQKLIRCKVPRLAKASSNSSQYAAVFKDTFVEDLWSLLSKLINEQVDEEDFTNIEWLTNLCELEDAYKKIQGKVNSLQYYTKAFLRNLPNSLENISCRSLEGYATLVFFSRIANRLHSQLRQTIESFIVEALESRTTSQFSLVKNIIRYDIPIDKSSVLGLFEETTNRIINSFTYSSDHFKRVDSLQKQIIYYCSEYQILCQNLSINTVDILLLKFKYFEDFFDRCMDDQMTIITIIEELGDMIYAYYPWRGEEYDNFVVRVICKMLDEDYLSSFISTYSMPSESFDSNRKAIMKNMITLTFNADIKNIEKVDRWLCKVSEEGQFSGIKDLVRSCCIFMNDIFPPDSKQDELLWNIYKRKYFLRSVLKSLGGSEQLIKTNERFDQQLLCCGLLKSVHILELQQLNDELIESLRMKRAPKITPVILKQSNISDSLDSSEISGLILPEPLNGMVNKQWEYYKVLDRNDHKTMSLQCQLNLLELKSPFRHGISSEIVILHVNLLQASIFHLFNNSARLSLEQIKNTLTETKHNIPQIDSNMEMFLQMNMFKKDSEDCFYLNTKYKPKKEALNDGKLTLYHLPKISPKIMENDKADNRWFTEIVCACIIRTLKQRRKCTKTKLFEYVASAFPGISRGEFKDALGRCGEYYTSENGNVQYLL